MIYDITIVIYYSLSLACVHGVILKYLFSD